MSISKQALDIFQQALAVAEAERETFLARACGDNADLLAEVQRLLAHDQRPLGRLDSAGAGVELLAEQIRRTESAGADLRRSETPFTVHIQSNQYRIIRVLGEGGMGTVYEAEQAMPRRTVALKALRRGLASHQLLRRLEHEAHVLGRLQHPGIAQIFEAGGLDAQNPDQAFIVMELVRGLTLTDYARRCGLSIRARFELMIRVCEAVQHAHQRGVIHRDLKPGNILVGFEDPEAEQLAHAAMFSDVSATGPTQTVAGPPQSAAGLPPTAAAMVGAGPATGVAGGGDSGVGGASALRSARKSSPLESRSETHSETRLGALGEGRVLGQPKILDFGIARLLDPDREVTTLHGRSGQLIGTLAYMSPEQVSDDPADVDTRSDVYALGVILYQLMTGVLPFDLSSRSLPDAARIIVEQDPPRPSTLNRALAGEIETIILKAMEKEKNRRYGSAAELAADLGRYLRNEPLAARPATTFYQLRKFAARHRALAAASLAVLLALVLGVAGTSWQALAAIQARNRALAAEEQQKQLRIRAEAAEVQALTEAARVRAQADKTERLNRFLREMLISPTPEVSAGSIVTIRDMLDAATARIPESLSSDPAIEATVREYLRDAYFGLGQYDAAHEHARSALRLWDEAADPDGLEAAGAAFGLARVLRHQGYNHEAQPFIEQALAVYVARLGPRHPETAAVLSLHAEILKNLGFLLEAEPLGFEALEIMQEQFGPESPEAISMLSNIARLMQTSYRQSEAEFYFKEALARARRTFSGDHVRLAALANNIALVLYDRGGRELEAAPYADEALEMARRVYPAEHPDIARLMWVRADVLLSLGRIDEAEPLAREALRQRRELYPANSTSAVEALTLYASVLAAWHDPVCAAEALELFEESARMAEIAAASISWMKPLAENGRAECLMVLGRLAEAEAELLRTYNELQRIRGDRDRRTLRAVRRLIQLYELTGQREELEFFRARPYEHW